MFRTWLLYRESLTFNLIVLTIFYLLTTNVCQSQVESSTVETKVYGPKNLLKALPTPFTTSVVSENQNYRSSDDSIGLNPIAISSQPTPLNLNRNNLELRFHGPKLFLPSRMVLGECSEFTIKGTPGHYAAIAMSENNKGAKPLYGNKLRLGADRKLVAVGIIPETGMLSLFIETPIQGDLVDASLYFEGVIWSKPDFSDMQMVSTEVISQGNSNENSVVVVGQQEKKQRAVVFDVSKPMSMRTVGGLSSGRP